jgi:hypothetical protein
MKWNGNTAAVYVSNPGPTVGHYGFTKENIVFFLAGLISILGILKIVLPELRHVVRSLWRDYKAAVIEWDDFREQRRKRKRLRQGSFAEEG